MTDPSSFENLTRRILELEQENTGLRQELEQVQRSESNFRMMVENVPDIIWTMSMDTMQIEYMSPSVTAMMGYSKEEILAKTFRDVLTPASFSLVAQHLQNGLAQLQTDPGNFPKLHALEVEYVSKDGSTLWVELTAKPVFNTQGKLVDLIGVSRDISQRIIAEKALKKSEEKYRSLFESSRDVNYITTLDGEIIEFNPAGMELFGYSKEDIIGADILTLYNTPEDRIKFKETIRQKGYVRDYEINFRKKDGTRIDCLLTSTFWQSEEGDILGYQGIIRDISDQKRMMRQFQQIQKMEAIGTLAGGIAHNFNNLLMTIQGNTSLMLMKTDPGHPHYKKLKTIEEHIQYGSDLSRQLLGFARGGQQQSKTVNLNTIIRMSAKVFASTKKDITVHTDLSSELMQVEADPSQIEQSLFNLLVNSGHAMPEGGDVYIHTENTELAAYQLAPYQHQGGRYIKLSVTDTGIGMDAKTKEKIFDPFFTTKEHGQGTGLGLSSVYGIIKNHGGYIIVYSEPGKGTTFNIYLPVSEKSSEKISTPAEPLLKGAETILIIDDEPMITTIGQTMLSEMGYTVITANDGEAALEIYNSAAKTIHLVILDLIMPKMSGSAVFARLKELDPQVRVLLSSGYSINGQASELMNKGCSGFIQKPFNMMEISKKVREVLDKKEHA
ncbi:MAG: PAS domain-containing sensor histidine kinase [Desulfobacteraceae bacterium]|nr:MAG: PAS domain-containing sensor histidine kinase [Desulfobacteraceae bacterium]